MSLERVTGPIYLIFGIVAFNDCRFLVKASHFLKGTYFEFSFVVFLDDTFELSSSLQVLTLIVRIFHLQCFRFMREVCRCSNGAHLKTNQKSLFIHQKPGAVVWVWWLTDFFWLSDFWPPHLFCPILKWLNSFLSYASIFCQKWRNMLRN